MYYVGLDLHKKYITGCALDSQGAVVATERRLPPVLETVLGWLAPRRSHSSSPASRPPRPRGAGRRYSAVESDRRHAAG